MITSDVHAPSTRKARIEIIPLIDVVFFLLATFVLFTLSLEKLLVLPVIIPVGGKEIPDPTMVYIQASEAGTVYWKQGADGVVDQISMTELPARLADARRGSAALRVFVRGDGKAKFGAAVQIFDEVRNAGIKSVSMETIPSPTGR